MKIHLVDGTYELFRAHFGAPPAAAPDGRPIGAVRGLVQTLLSLLRQDDVTHAAIAFDTVIESFRNDLFDGYKTGEGVPEELRGAVRPGGARRSRAGHRRLADGRVRGRRRHRHSSRAMGQRARRRPGRHLLARQGPDATRDRRQDRLPRPPEEYHPRRGGRARQVRRRPGVDPRLPRARGRLCRRHPRRPPLGRQVDRDHARPLPPRRENPGRRGRLGRQAEGRPRDGRQPARARRRGGALPPPRRRFASTCRCRSRSRTWSGAGPTGPRTRRSASSTASKISSTRPTSGRRGDSPPCIMPQDMRGTSSGQSRSS